MNPDVAALVSIRIVEVPWPDSIEPSDTSRGTVWVIDATTNQGIATISTGVTGYKNIAINTVSNKIYIANQGAGSVTVIDGATNTVKTSVSVPGCPTGIDANPYTNKIYVSSQCTGDNLYVIDGKTDTLTSTVIPLGGVASTVTVDPIGNDIYVRVDTPFSTARISGVLNREVRARLTDVLVYASDPYAGYYYGSSPDGSTGVVSNFGKIVTDLTILGGIADAGTSRVYTASSGPNPVVAILRYGREIQRLPLNGEVSPGASRYLAIIPEKRLYVLQADRKISVIWLASDELIIGSMTVTGSKVSVPIYLKDSAASPLGMDHSARFSNFLQDVATDSRGNVFVADWQNANVRKISPNGIVTTIAGAPSGHGYCCRADGDGGPASEAHFESPSGIVVDDTGNVFVSDINDHRVRRISASSGLISTVAGTGRSAFSGDGGPATSADLTSPRDVEWDPFFGDLYIADSGNLRVRKVSQGGMISTVAGNGTDQSTGDNGPATSAGVVPEFLAVDLAGNGLIGGDHVVRRVHPFSRIIVTLAGSAGVSGSQDGLGPSARFGSIAGLAPDRNSRDVFVTEMDNHTIRRVTADGVVTTYAGSAGIYGTANGERTIARFASPRGIAGDESGNLFVTDSSNTVRKIGTDGVVSTFASHPFRTGLVDGGPLPRIQGFSFTVYFSDPSKIAGCSNATFPDCQVRFVPAGVLAGKTPKVQSVARSADGISVSYSYDEATAPLTFTSEADDPGDLIGYLDITLSSAAVSGDTIVLSNVRGSVASNTFQLTDTSGTVRETYPDVLFVPGTITVASSPNCFLALTRPDGGEVWMIGSTHEIRWSAAGACGSTLTIELLKGGSLYDTITTTATTFNGLVGHTVPTTYATASDYRIRIRDNSTSTTATSARDFTIAPGPVSCPVMVPSFNVFITFIGQASGCSAFRGPCNTGEAVAMTVATFGYSLDCAAHTFAWSFGDGSATTTGRSVTHTYAQPGTYSISVRVHNGSQIVDLNETIQVASIPAFTTSFTSASVQGLPNGVTFTPSVNPSNTAVAKVTWNFGDGFLATATSLATQVHLYPGPGTYAVTLAVESTTGLIATFTKNVSVGLPTRRRGVRH